MRPKTNIADAGEGPAAAPRLLIDGRRRDAGGIGLGERVLGLSLAERLARAARRSGYGRIIVLTAPGETAPLREQLKLTRTKRMRIINSGALPAGRTV